MVEERAAAALQQEEEEERVGGPSQRTPEQWRERARERGRGTELPTAERAFFEECLGYDFGSVRIYDDEWAHLEAAELSAQAFTIGTDIAFANGHWAPGSAAGRQLLGHELAHVIQQDFGGRPALQAKGVKDDAREREADAVAERAVTRRPEGDTAAGEAASGTTGRPPDGTQATGQPKGEGGAKGERPGAEGQTARGRGGAGSTGSGAPAAQAGPVAAPGGASANAPGRGAAQGPAGSDEASVARGAGPAPIASAGEQPPSGGSDAGTAPEPEEEPEPEIPQIQWPRLGVFPSLRVEEPPPQVMERAEAIRTETGLAPEEHHRRVRQTVDTVLREASAAQAEIARRIGHTALNARMAVEEIADRIPGYVAAAVGHVDAAVAAAEAQIKEACQRQCQRIWACHETRAAELALNSDRAAVQVRDQLVTSSENVWRLNSELQVAFDGYVKDAAPLVMAVPETGLESTVPVPPGRGGGAAGPGSKTGAGDVPKEAKSPNPIEGSKEKILQSLMGGANWREKFGNKRCRDITPYALQARQRSLVEHAERTAAQLGSPPNRAAFLNYTLGLIAPVVDDLKKDKAGAVSQAEFEAQQRAQEQKTAQDQATDALQKQRDGACRYLRQEGDKLKTSLRRMGQKAQRSLRRKAQIVEAGTANSAVPMADSYPDLVRRLEAVVAPGRFLDVRAVLGQVEGALQSVQGLREGHLRAVDEQVAGAIAESLTALEENGKQLLEAADGVKKTLEDAVLRADFDFELAADKFTGALEAGADTAMARAARYADRVAKDLLDSTAQAHDGLSPIQARAIDWLNKAIAGEARVYNDAASVQRIIWDLGNVGGQFQITRAKATEDVSHRVDRLKTALSTSVWQSVKSLGGTKVDDDAVLSILGELSWPGAAAIREQYEESKASRSLAEDMKAMADRTRFQALGLLSESAWMRADARSEIAKDSTGTFTGPSRETREAVLRGFDQAERDALGTDALNKLYETLRNELSDREYQISEAYLDLNKGRVLALRVEENLQKARRKGDDAVYQAMDQMAQLAQTEAAGADSPEEMQLLLDKMFVEHARLKDPFNLQPISPSEARQRFADRATADYDKQELRSQLDDPEARRRGAAYGPGSMPVRMNERAATTIRSMIIAGPDHKDTITARAAYELDRAQYERGSLSESTKMRLTTALEDRGYALAEREYQHEYKGASRERRQQLDAQIAEARTAHKERLDSVAAALGKRPEELQPFVEATFGEAGSTEQRNASEMLERGRASLYTSIRLSTDGAGTHEDLLRHSYTGRSREEIAEARTKYREEQGEDLDEMLGTKGDSWFAEVSGDLKQELQRLSLGDGASDLDNVNLSALEHVQQTGDGTGLVASKTMEGTPEQRYLKHRQRELGQAVLDAAGIKDGSPEDVFNADGTMRKVYRDLAFDKEGKFRGDRVRLRNLTQAVHLAADGYRAEVDRQESVLTGLITALAVVVTVALMFIPGVNVVAAGILTALITGAATIAVKAGMRGGRYGWEEMATDAGTTAIEAATAGLGAGLGGALGKGAIGGRLAKAGELMNKSFGRVGGSMARQALTGTISGAAQTAIQDETWADGIGKGLDRVASGGLRNAAVAVVSTGVSESLEGRLGQAMTPNLVNPAQATGLQQLGRAIGPSASRVVREVISQTVGGMAGEGASILWEINRGEFHGGMKAAIDRIGQTGARELFSTTLRSSKEAHSRSRYQAIAAELRSRPPGQPLSDREVAMLRRAALSAGVMQYGPEEADGTPMKEAHKRGEDYDWRSASAQRIRSSMEADRQVLAGLPPGLRRRAAGLESHDLLALHQVLGSETLGAPADRLHLLKAFHAAGIEIDARTLLRELNEARSTIVGVEAQARAERRAARAQQAEAPPASTGAPATRAGAAGSGAQTAGPSARAAQEAEIHRAAVNPPHVQERARAAVAAMTEEQRAAYHWLLGEARSPAQRVVVERTVAAGHSLEEATKLLANMRALGLSDGDILRRFTGAGLVQFSQFGCVPASYQIARAELDPVYANRLHTEPLLMAAEQQEALLATGGNLKARESEGQRKVIEALLGKPPADPAAQLSYNARRTELEQYYHSGSNFRYTDSDGIEPLQLHGREIHLELERVAGVRYDVHTNADLPWEHGTGAGQFRKGRYPHDEIRAALERGLPVPFSMVLGSPHELVFIGLVAHGSEVRYLVHDPDNGRVFTRSPSDLDAFELTSVTLPRLPGQRPKMTPPQVVPEVAPAATGAGATQAGGRSGSHPGVELHNHLLGVVDVNYFIHHAGGGSPRKLLEHLQNIFKDPDLQAQEPHAARVLRDLEQKAAKRREEGGSDKLSSREVRTALKRLLTATAQTPFDSAYTPRDELIQRHLIVPAEQMRSALAQALSAHSSDAQLTAAQHQHLLRTFGKGGDEQVALAALGRASVGEIVEVGGLTPQQAAHLKDIVVRTRYEVFVEHTMRVLAQDSIGYSEQSISVNKLLKRMPTTMLENIQRRLQTSGVETELRFLAMVDTQHLSGAYLEKVNKDTGRPALLDRLGIAPALQRRLLDTFGEPGMSDGAVMRRLADLPPSVLEAVGGISREQARAIALVLPPELRAQLRQVLARGDVMGIDIAAPEAERFSERGLRNFSDMYDLLRVASRERGRPLVLRPHVGEGYPLMPDGQPQQRYRGRRDADGVFEHYKLAEDNLNALLGHLESMGYSTAKGAQDGVIIRLGHATHATPAQVARMKALGLYAEANLTSNVQTGALSPVRGGRGDFFENHALLNLIHKDVPTILGTDAQGVMHTTLTAEYREAGRILRQFRSNQLPMELDGRKIYYRDLGPEDRARFDRGEQSLRRWATEYHEMTKAVDPAPTPPAKGGTPPPRPTGRAGAAQDGNEEAQPKTVRLGSDRTAATALVGHITGAAGLSTRHQALAQDLIAADPSQAGLARVRQALGHGPAAIEFLDQVRRSVKAANLSPALTEILFGQMYGTKGPALRPDQALAVVESLAAVGGHAAAFIESRIRNAAHPEAQARLLFEVSQRRAQLTSGDMGAVHHALTDVIFASQVLALKEPLLRLEFYLNAYNQKVDFSRPQRPEDLARRASFRAAFERAEGRGQRQLVVEASLQPHPVPALDAARAALTELSALSRATPPAQPGQELLPRPTREALYQAALDVGAPRTSTEARGLISQIQIERVVRCLSEMDAPTRAHVDELLARAASPTERTLILGAIAARADAFASAAEAPAALTQVRTFAEEIRGMPRMKLLLATSMEALVPNLAQPGTMQGGSFQHSPESCGPTSALGMKGILDPISAWEWNRNPAAYVAQQRRIMLEQGRPFVLRLDSSLMTDQGRLAAGQATTAFHQLANLVSALSNHPQLALSAAEYHAIHRFLGSGVEHIPQQSHADYRELRNLYDRLLHVYGPQHVHGVFSPEHLNAAGGDPFRAFLNAVAFTRELSPGVPVPAPGTRLGLYLPAMMKEVTGHEYRMEQLVQGKEQASLAAMTQALDRGLPVAIRISWFDRANAEVGGHFLYIHDRHPPPPAEAQFFRLHDPFRRIAVWRSAAQLLSRDAVGSAIGGTTKNTLTTFYLPDASSAGLSSKTKTGAGPNAGAGKEDRTLLHVEGPLPAPTSRGYKDALIPGLYERISRNQLPTELRKVHVEKNFGTVTVMMAGQRRRMAQVKNHYDADAKTLTLQVHKVHQELRTVTTGGEGLRGSRVPTSVWGTLLSMRELGIPFGGLRTLYLDNIQHLDTVLTLHQLKQLGPIGPQALPALLDTTLLRNARTIARQSGHRIVGIRLIAPPTDEQGPFAILVRYSLQEYLDHWGRQSRYNDDQAFRASLHQQLAQRGLTLHTEIIVGYDIALQLEPIQ